MGESWIRGVTERPLAGRPPCDTCPAYRDGRGELATPGFGNPNGRLMVVTSSPLTAFDRAAYESWRAFNEDHKGSIQGRETGGPDLGALLDPIRGLELDDVWVGHTIKCPPGPDASSEERAREFEACRPFLETEIATVDPELILGLGATACLRTLAVLGVRRSHVPVSEECGRIFQTTPPLVVGPHWQYGWLERDLPTEWGVDWRDAQPHLDESYDTHREVLQAAIATHLDTPTTQD